MPDRQWFTAPEGLVEGTTRREPLLAGAKGESSPNRPGSVRDDSGGAETAGAEHDAVDVVGDK